MKQSKAVGASKPGVAGKTPGKEKKPSNLTQGIHQNNGHQADGLDKYFQVLPLVENFLNETDPKLKKDNGIFFTPYPVVSFIVRSIHEILKEKFGKPLGVADETVKILDPAAGTGVFLIAAARLAIDEMARKYGKEKAHAFARRYMLNNLYGIEKEMSLHAVSCLKLAHFFQSLNLRLHANERFNLYWADALENSTENVHFNVILGNPPYSVISVPGKLNPTREKINNDLKAKLSTYTLSKRGSIYLRSIALLLFSINIIRVVPGSTTAKIKIEDARKQPFHTGL